MLHDTITFSPLSFLFILGSDWDGPRALGVTAAVVGWILFIWMFLFSCVTHPKALRWILGLLVVVLVSRSFPFSIVWCLVIGHGHFSYRFLFSGYLDVGFPRYYVRRL